MKVPCVERLDWLVVGLSFLQPALTTIQLSNLTLVATALVLGSRFNLSEISRMWLKTKGVSTLSYFSQRSTFLFQRCKNSMQSECSKPTL